MFRDILKLRKAAIIISVTAPVISAFFCLYLWGGGVSGGEESQPIITQAVNQTAVTAAQDPDPNRKPTVAVDYGRLPLYFIANQGQVDQRVKFYARGCGQTTFFTKNEVILTLARPTPNTDPNGTGRRFQPASNKKPHIENRKVAVVRIKPLGLEKGVTIAALNETEHRVNYFIGKDPKKWRTDIPTYQAVVYKNAYAGIDLKFHGQGRCLEYDVVVKPGADPSQVQFAYEGVKKLEITSEGDLTLRLTDGGRLLQKRPMVYQKVVGQMVPVEAKFRLCHQGAQVTCGFAVAAYDRRYPLIIDPVLMYSTYLGGNNNYTDIGYSIAVDAAGNAYIAGETNSDDFPLQNALKSIRQGSDAFVTKLNAAGSGLVYSTFLGGSDRDAAYAIALDNRGYSYMTGYTRSTDFPVSTSAPQKNYGGADADAFIVKLNPNGSAFVYGTYHGGNGNDHGEGIALDSQGNALVTGFTASTNLWTVNAAQSTYGGGAGDAFVAKVNAAGTAFVYSTYLGGKAGLVLDGLDIGKAIALNKWGDAFVVGQTGSVNFPTKKAFQPFIDSTPGNVYDTFVTQYRPDGEVVNSTHLGGSKVDKAFGVVVDLYGNVFVTGFTYSDDFPTTNVMRAYSWKGDPFVVKINSSGTAVISMTYLGGYSEDESSGIAVDEQGSIYLTGYTFSDPDEFPLVAAVQNQLNRGGTWTPVKSDAFIMKLNNNLDIIYSTYLGGEQNDVGHAIAVDFSGNAYVTGKTEGPNFPTTENAFDQEYGGSLVQPEPDVFVAKIGTAAPGPGELNEALDNMQLTFLTGGAHPWFKQVTEKIYGDSAAQSGTISLYGYSWMKTMVTGPGRLTFYWKISSNELFGDMFFYIDDYPIALIYGDVEWSLNNIFIPAGTHTLEWWFCKWFSGSYGSDCGWVDKVEYRRFKPLTGITPLLLD